MERHNRVRRKTRRRRSMCGCAYYEGYWKALEGSALEANPYEPTKQNREWLNWRDGWEDAQLEREMSDR
jgi:ribosome modulation factor